MVKGKRASLASLPIGQRAQGKPPTADKASQGPDGAGTIKTILLRISEPGWRELRLLSMDTGKPVDSLLIEAANDLLARHGRPAVVEKRLPRKPGGEGK